MGYFAFFLVITAACLLWSAACTAAAARSARRRALWLFLGVALPVLALLPWLWASGWLAFGARMRPNWFGPVLTVALSALVGGLWISRAGMMTIASSAVAVASRWPVIGLFAFAILAKAVSFGTLLILDNAVAAEARAMRVEAAAIMQAALPPTVADAENAARLHLQAGAAIAAAPDLTAADGPLADPQFDIASPAVGDLLTHHAALVDTIRRAADMPGCRFARDWARPSIEMLLPEMQAMRTEARILALAARRGSFEGRHAEAVADAVRLGNLGRQAGSEPILVSSLVGLAIDGEALSVVADVLPRLGPGDAALLDDPGLRDLVSAVPSIVRAVNGEEAFGLAMFADFADGREDIHAFGRLSSDATPTAGEGHRLAFLADPRMAIYRVFFLPADLAGYRDRFRKLRSTAARSVDQRQGWPEMKRDIDAIDTDPRRGPDGALARLIVPATEAVFRAQSHAVARHRAAEVLLAATRERLAAGALPAAIDSLVPARLPSVPRDPFTSDSPMRAAFEAGEFSVWSVGPNGTDDGGPVAAGNAPPERGDDIGLRMRSAGP
ncbi:MAG: hypothetical protein RLZZ326_2122 [Planctomycetota bacterium]|jgi:hypothetical protein